MINSKNINGILSISYTYFLSEYRTVLFSLRNQVQQITYCYYIIYYTESQGQLVMFESPRTRKYIKTIYRKLRGIEHWTLKFNLTMSGLFPYNLFIYRYNSVYSKNESLIGFSSILYFLFHNHT